MFIGVLVACWMTATAPGVNCAMAVTEETFTTEAECIEFTASVAEATYAPPIIAVYYNCKEVGPNV